ncbi:hypothetical protein [Chengkuizengella axinellae]|uniref:Uncharacterized protein n=1 Tax=Chengkuizengella axinellae TaxID=3064388 RepID=A0ABT9IV95_9BACL|nr:hypothetical protein [Chengkuizengella sp. 2205SS18-9]MDP5273247.1 hypothetical protein [Chengkuizengella sp. 2205SS18-9]
MDLKQLPFVVNDSVSVLDPYGGEGAIIVIQNGMAITTPFPIISSTVCVKQSQKTKVSLDFLSQVAIEAMGSSMSFGLYFSSSVMVFLLVQLMMQWIMYLLLQEDIQTLQTFL